MAKKKINNEAIITALLQYGTVTAAAKALNATPRTIYNRMKDLEFRAAYMEARNDILRQAVFNINSSLTAAIDTVAEIMTDKEVKPAIRLQAAQVIIGNVSKFTQRLAADERASATATFDFF